METLFLLLQRLVPQHALSRLLGRLARARGPRWLREAITLNRRMIDEFHQEAERTGARIVLAAGVDSIPSDLGVQLAIERLVAKGGRRQNGGGIA